MPVVDPRILARCSAWELDWLRASGVRIPAGTVPATIESARPTMDWKENRTNGHAAEKARRERAKIMKMTENCHAA